MKQRLIDANKAKVILWGYSRYSGIDEAPYSYAEEAIDILPTIDAIPVDWILKWANKNCMYCYDYDYPTEKTDGWLDINNMINEWERENETN